MARKRLNAPLGWDNSVELLASVVDAVNVLTRVLINVNSERPDTNPVPQVPRPYEVTATDATPETISLTAFGDLLKETS